MTYHLRTGTATAGNNSMGVHADAFTEICTAPCDASLPSGTHTLALSYDEGVPVSAGRIEIDGPTALEGTYIDRTGLRVAGWVVFLGSALAGGALMFSSIGDEDSSTGIGVGGGIMLGGMIVGMILALQGDGADIVKR